MKVYLVRHGQSELNATHVHQYSDTPLSPLGQEQANRVAERMKSIPIEKIFTSDYSRAHQTAEIIAEKIDKPITLLNLLRERKRPSEILGQPLDDPTVTSIKELIKVHGTQKEWHYSDEENFYDVLERVKELISLLQKEKKEGTNHLLLVTHGTIMRLIILYLLLKDKINPDIFHEFVNSIFVSNTGITMCEYKNDEWKLLTWNDYAHLGE